MITITITREQALFLKRLIVDKIRRNPVRWQSSWMQISVQIDNALKAEEASK